jgi:hypothetical protein
LRVQPMSSAMYCTINKEHVIVVSVNFNNGMSQQYIFIELENGIWRLRGEVDPERQSENILPVTPRAVGFNFTQKRAIFILCKLAEQYPGALPDGSMPWYKRILSRLMITAPARESQMSRQEFKDSVFDVWNSQFSCSSAMADSVIDHLTRYMACWKAVLLL